MDSTKRKQQAKTLRIFRKVHRSTGALLFVFFFFISVSGIVLGWKKDSGGLILPESYEGSTTQLEEWMPLEDLHQEAVRILHDSISTDLSAEINRIDVRKEKGMVKFIFEDHYYGIQLDGATGELLHIGKRHSDLIENIHDGSVVDDYFGFNGVFKLIYTSVMGIALLIFTITGFWLWYGPKRMRKANKN
ncbi:PepSY domain-containing protein [Christiangramia salexigens]|uniref:DNA mismatch repair protein n=1 Tax=Christiangramia salexigens TaxID=1913577 RepID=A0A1L3J1Z8_9FLAO|nr:PepSY domain-containing protein [Christiangramia salexigens]APG59138.1 DNA mismatch repair protein [Christiangramia salexigens]